MTVKRSKQLNNLHSIKVLLGFAAETDYASEFSALSDSTAVWHHRSFHECMCELISVSASEQLSYANRRAYAYYVVNLMVNRLATCDENYTV